MASVSVSEDTFDALASAAHLAKSRGDRRLADRLDRLARMVNAALSNAKTAKLRRHSKLIIGDAPSLTWRDVPSLFESTRG